MQTRKGSLIETITNLVTGIVMSLIISHFVFPLYGFKVTLEQNFAITAIFTVASFIRSYSLRRIFNHISIKFKV